MGMGRLGQILGPLGFGALVAHQVSVAMIFVVAAIPCVLAAIAVGSLAAYEPAREPIGAAAE